MPASSPFLASIDRSDGRVFLLTTRLSEPVFGGSVVRGSDGVWSPCSVSADDLKDNFNRVTDPNEADALLKEATAAASSMPSRASV